MSGAARRAVPAATLALVSWPVIARAHAGGDVAGGFLTGFLHPLGGLDHVVAMVGVGLWGAQLGNPAIWILPVTFPLVMAVGGMLGIRGVPIPAPEVGIALSGIVLGGMIAFAVRAPLGIAAVLVGAFAIFHGHAHGTELPASATPLAYSAGFVVSTGLLHAAGIAIGALIYWRTGTRVVRACGAVIAACGLWFLFA